MAFSSGSRRSESGAQLLARLSTRPDIKGIDSFIFERTMSPSQIIELYGMEGTGKTEIALQCSARICLPSSWNGILLSGLQAKLIYVDTDSKFSILRLAVILEKQILEMTKSNSAYKSKLCENAAFQGSLQVNCDNAHYTEVDSEEKVSHCPKAGMEKQAFLREDETDTPMLQMLPEQHSINISCSVSDESNARNHSSSVQPQNVIHNTVLNNSEQKNEIINENETSDSYSHARHIFSPEELEEIIQDSLSRVQVLRPSNSQQLLSSLLSLENILMEDTLYTLVIVDSISAFYWLDRLASPNSYQHLDSRMAPIAKTLKRYASEFGVTCLITKSAFFGREKRLNEDYTATVSGNSSKMEKTFNPYTYNEYLGKIWSSLNVKRIVLTSTFDIMKKGETKVAGKMTEEMKKIRAYCMSSETVKQYVFKEDLLVPDTCISVQGSQS